MADLAGTLDDVARRVLGALPAMLEGARARDVVRALGFLIDKMVLLRDTAEVAGRTDRQEGSNAMNRGVEDLGWWPGNDESATVARERRHPNWKSKR
jgi:hypothetical protein